MPKPRIVTNCVANHYAAPNERIIEFDGTDRDHGGLISIRIMDDGRMRVDVYRQGSKVDVGIGTPDPSLTTEATK